MKVLPSDAASDRERLRTFAFYAVAVLVAYLVYEIFRPFLVPLAWAAVLAICFYPMHEWVERRVGGRGAAALVSTTCVALLVIVPMLAVAAVFVSETTTMLGDVPRLLAEAPASIPRWLHATLRNVPGANAVDPGVVLAEPAKRLGAYLSAQAAAIVQGMALFIVHFVITLFALFFLFRDGPTVMSTLRRLLPVEREARERLIQQTGAIVTSSILASVVVAAAQGALGAVAFWIVGLPAPLFWGAVMTLCCLLPLGAWVVWLPAAIWLMAAGNVGRGVVLVGLGLTIVSGVDNVLRPALISRRSEMNGLLLLISLIGGVTAFGSVGLVAGPVLMATAIAALDALSVDHDITHAGPSL